MGINKPGIPCLHSLSWIQVRNAWFCDVPFLDVYKRQAVDDRTGFRAVDTVDQLPCMLVQAETAQRAFRCVVIKRDFTVIPVSYTHLDVYKRQQLVI